MPDRYRLSLWLLLGLAIPAAHADDEAVPPLEMLSFIAKFTHEDEWIDPMTIDNLLTVIEQPVEERQSNENRKADNP